MLDKVTRLRQLLSEAVPKRPEPSPAESSALRDFEIYQLNAPTPIQIDQNARARALREVARIANWYGWQGEVLRVMDCAGVATVAALSDCELDDLLVRLRTLEDCVQAGIDAPDAPPAR